MYPLQRYNDSTALHIYPLIERTPAQMRTEVYDNVLYHLGLDLTPAQCDAIVRIILDKSDCADMLRDVAETPLMGDIEAAIEELEDALDR